jgi:cell division protein FtsZ
VSVVATGIEVDAATMPEPSKSFSFAPRTPGRDDRSMSIPQPAPQPLAEVASPPPVAIQTPPVTMVDDEPPIVLEAPETAKPAAAATSLFSDELLLEPEAVVPAPAQPAPEPAPEAGTRRWLSNPEEPAAEAPRTRPAAGATLFERMSNIARGAAKAQVEDETPADRDGDVPRFLGRQGNQ